MAFKFDREIENTESIAFKPFETDFEGKKIVVRPSVIGQSLNFDMNDATGAGGAIVERLVTFTSGDATPAVANANVFITAGTTAITSLDDGVVGQCVKILASASITMTDGATLQLNGDADYAMTVGDTLTVCMFETGVFVETARSVQ